MKPISIKQARLHNLKNIDIDIPKDRFVVVTGVSGSGKSTLVFDILFEAGRKSYLQAIGILDGLGDNAGYEQITGLRPAVAIKQGLIRRSNPRSVVGTRTRALNLLGTLFADHYNQTVSPEDAITSAHFSFNSPVGMCLQCEGRGHEFALDLDVLLPTKTTTLPELYQNANSTTRFFKASERLAKQYEFDLATPFEKLPKVVRDIVLYGRLPNGKKRTGLDDQLKYRLLNGKDGAQGMTVQLCPSCQGSRVGDEARDITIDGKHIGELGHMTIARLRKFLDAYQKRSKTRKSSIPSTRELILTKIQAITDSLTAVKLDYLSLYRPIPTLSGGEAQRLSLMSCLTTEMESLLYIFDEPTAGLHELEKQELLEKLQSLRQQGNALIVVEHDTQCIQAAEHIIDIGPLAGQQGGEVVYQGKFAGLTKCKQSLTGQYLSGKVGYQRSEAYKPVNKSTPAIALTGVRTNNLKSVDVTIPLGMIVGVAGVSGSGKSSLIADTLVPLLHKQFVRDQDDVDPTINLSRPSPQLESIKGADVFSQCIEVGQSPIGRRSNSNPATYLGIWNRIRSIFAHQSIAKSRGYDAGYFSFNANGACDSCQGSGQHRMWIGSTFVTYQCDVCQGERYKREVLDVLYKGHTINQVLALSAQSALPLFGDDRPISRMLNTLVDTGMGYISLGQPTATLSGGEAQRIKLAKELGRSTSPTNTLFILDEPTTGLSSYDAVKLLSIIDKLIDRGNSVLIIEHDPLMLSYCDWIIEMGPGGGHEGGKIIAKGSPTQLAKRKTSRIGPFLTPQHAVCTA